MEERKTQEEIQEYLAKIRRTVSQSQALIESVNQRFRETDKLLADNGMTREQVLAWRPTGEQRLAVNEALKAHGLPPIEEDETLTDFDAATARLRKITPTGVIPSPDSQNIAQEEKNSEDLTDERQRKFNNFMQKYRM